MPSDEMMRKALQACTVCHAPNRILINGVWVCTACDDGGWVLHNQHHRRR